MDPNSNPNLNQSLFGTVNDLGATNAKNKNIIDIIKDQILKSPEWNKGYKEIIKNILENTKPKDFSEDISVWILLFILDIVTWLLKF